ncbi:MAG: ParB/RepB/Spo0J family partition protein [Oscillospiraceae bacterium]|nr:ParB/RepB/Spo0J family partition protein [Oscillospiraceae bacterium]
MKFDINTMIGQGTNAVAGKITDVAIDLLHPYKNHKFSLYTGERFEDMVESVRQNGILTPIIVRPDYAQGGYEILAGHNRCQAAKAAKLDTVPAIVKEDLTEAEAEMYVVETNLLQRGFKDLLLTEQAAVVALRHSKMFSSKKSEEIKAELSAMQNGQSKLSITGEEYGLSRCTVARLIRINVLITRCCVENSGFGDILVKKVNDGSLPIRAAVELSYISPKILTKIWSQTDFFDENKKVSAKLAESLRTELEDCNDAQDAETINKAKAVLDSDTEKKPKQFKIKPEIYDKYFSPDDSQDYFNSVISAALEKYFAEDD